MRTPNLLYSLLFLLRPPSCWHTLIPCYATASGAKKVPKLNLTDLSLRSLKPGMYWDVTVPAFGIRVQKRRRTFLVMMGRERKRIPLGHWPQTKLADARTNARRILYADEQPATTSLSMLAAVDKYFDTIRLSPRWEREQRRLIRKHFLTKHGARDIATVTTQHILHVTDALAGRPSEQVHTHKALQTFFRWAFRRSLIDQDPMARLKLPAKLSTRERVLSYDELAKVWAASDQLGNFGGVVRLLILTGQRRGEIGNIHLATTSNDAITWPKHIIKNRREHTIPLTPRTAHLVPQIEPQFAWSKPKVQLDKLCGVVDWTLHDLRRTFATNLAELGVAPHIIERILNHITGSISPLARIYNRATYHKEMRAALELYEHHLFTHVLACNP